MGGNVREWGPRLLPNKPLQQFRRAHFFGGPQENVEQQNTVRGGSRHQQRRPLSWHRSGLPGGLREVDLGFRCAQLTAPRNTGMDCISGVDASLVAVKAKTVLRCASNQASQGIQLGHRTS